MSENIRKSEIKRVTNETSVTLSLKLWDGVSHILSSNAFFDHMLELFAKHGGFTVSLDAKGDTDIDFHHTAEDIGIVMGRAFHEAAGDKRGINRYGSCLLPMDEALIESAVDFGGRFFIAYNVTYPKHDINGFDLELIEEFWRAFAMNAKINLHINMRAGTNAHHIAEGLFKSVARSLRQALTVTGDTLMSTKGVLE